MKDTRLYIRLDVETKERLFKDARELGVSVSDYIRGLLGSRVVPAKVEEQGVMLNEFGKEVTFTTPEDIEPAREFKSYFK